MSFHWSDYLELAEELQSKAVTSIIHEAYLRTAISRAYYAAFITARNYLYQVEGEKFPSSAKAHDLI